MIDEGKLNEAIIGYKQFLPKHWPEERFKWEAVKNFQDVWDPDANDFAKMLEQALSKTENLLTSQKYFPARMIVKFAEAYPDRVREMFVSVKTTAPALHEVDGRLDSCCPL